jgi:AraC-like DNA-binding protein
MPARLESFSFGKTWHTVSTDYFEGHSNGMTDYHMHDYYEISLILSGRVKVLLSDTAEQSEEAKLVLLRPYTPHYIVCDPEALYRRHNLLFSPDFLADYTADLQLLLPAFGKNGAVLELGTAKAEQLLTLIKAIQAEQSPLRQRLLILYLLSLAAESAPKTQTVNAVPPLISEALDHVAEHFAEHLSAEQIAKALHVSRTTLMITFKKHTGVTLNQYVTHYRLKNAIAALSRGEREPEVARSCGFTDQSNMIRCFKKHLGKSPMRYLADQT